MTEILPAAVLLCFFAMILVILDGYLAGKKKTGDESLDSRSDRSERPCTICAFPGIVIYGKLLDQFDLHLADHSSFLPGAIGLLQERLAG